MESALSFEQRLDDSPLTFAMKRLWALSAGLIALDGFDFFIIGVALPLLEKHFSLSATEIGAIAVAAIFGALVGSLTLGPVTDKIGRQTMLLVDVILFLVATAGTVLAWNAESLIFFRFLVGVAIGADYPISVSYITENVPSRLRGSLVIAAFSFQSVGALLGAITGIFVIDLAPDTAIAFGWRWMLGVGLILALGVAVMRFSFLLESPRYYISKEDYQGASAAASILLDTPITITKETEPPSEEINLPYSALFSRQYLRDTLLASLPWFLQDIATYGIGIFTPKIISILAFSENKDFLGQQLDAARGSAFVDVFLILGFLFAIVLVERLGRIRLQIIGFLGMAVGLLILALGSQSNQVNIAMIFGGFLVFNLMMNAGPNSTTFLLSGELFPTSIRASGAGFASAFAKTGAVLGTFFLPILQTRLGIPLLLELLAIICLLAAIITYLLRIETTGKSLELVNVKK